MASKSSTLWVLALTALVALSGCLGDDDKDGGDGTEPILDDDMADGPKTTDTTNNLGASVATPVRTFSNGAQVAFSIDANTTGVILEYVWTPEYPTNAQATAWVDHAGAGTIPPSDPTDLIDRPAPVTKQTGSSPIRIVFDGDALPDAGEYQTILRAAEPVGVQLQQDWTVHVTVFRDMPFDAGFSALDA